MASERSERLTLVFDEFGKERVDRVMSEYGLSSPPKVVAAGIDTLLTLRPFINRDGVLTVADPSAGGELVDVEFHTLAAPVRPALTLIDLQAERAVRRKEISYGDYAKLPGGPGF